jgi:hypothetical protein
MGYDWYQKTLQHYSDDGWINPLGGVGMGRNHTTVCGEGMGFCWKAMQKPNGVLPIAITTLGLLQVLELVFVCVRPVNDCFDNATAPFPVTL